MTNTPFLQPLAIAPHRIHPATRPAYVHLKVANLERQLYFYRNVIGLQLHWQEGKSAGLGVKSPGEKWEDLVRLTEVENGRRYQGVTGLYHFALLLPDRRELARLIARLFALHWLNFPTDHVMTKTTYLEDPEGNTIEVYCESPEDGIFAVDSTGNFYARHRDGRQSDGREPLDLQELFSHLAERDEAAILRPLPPDTRMGHFHLYVSDLQETRKFYHEGLGFDDMGIAHRFGMGMVSAGGYHHHIGYNIWRGIGAPPPPADALGLQWIAFDLPGPAAFEAFIARVKALNLPYHETEEGILVSDPSHNAVLFRSGKETPPPSRTSAESA